MLGGAGQVVAAERCGAVQSRRRLTRVLEAAGRKEPLRLPCGARCERVCRVPPVRRGVVQPEEFTSDATHFVGRGYSGAVIHSRSVAELHA